MKDSASPNGKKKKKNAGPDLPHGVTYKISPVHSGDFYPGSENVPTITFIGRGAVIQYRLGSLDGGFSVVDDDQYQEGDLDRGELDAIGEWVGSITDQFISNHKIRHYVYFQANSACYFDLIRQELYGAAVRNELTSGEKEIIDQLTRIPGKPLTTEVLLDKLIEIGTAGSLRQTFSTLKKCDPAISATFKSRGGYCYTGLEPVWTVDENPGSAKEQTPSRLSIENIFTLATDVLKVVVIATEARGRLHAALRKDILPGDMLLFLGADAALFEPDPQHVDRLVREGFFESAEELKKLLGVCCRKLDAVWTWLHKHIRQNYEYSLRALSYHAEEERFPEIVADLNDYPVSGNRLANSLERICPAIEKTIRETTVYRNYFTRCDRAVTPETAIDYIVALLLICFGNFQTVVPDMEQQFLESDYQEKLLDFIREKFHYDPPAGDGSLPAMLEELRELLGRIRQVGLAGDNPTVVTDANEMLNSRIYSHGDDNDRTPPTHTL